MFAHLICEVAKSNSINNMPLCFKDFDYFVPLCGFKKSNIITYCTFARQASLGWSEAPTRQPLSRGARSGLAASWQDPCVSLRSHPHLEDS